tara:strand:- start:95 stop:1486 length:1392 start_codon:yes stop_codon:yes gene_type:complete
MAELQYAGEYDITHCKILTTSGQEFDILPVVQDIVIFESIFSQSISGTITIQDTSDIVNNGPIIGEEKLQIKLLTPQENERPETIIDFVKTPLDIYKIGAFMGDGEKATVVTLHFASQEVYKNAVSKISRSYKGSCSEIVDKIFRDKEYLDSDKKLNLEETNGLKKIIFPSMKPFKAIDMLCRQSNSKNFKNSPTYLFYETTKSYNFRSVDGLCSQEPIMEYEENVPDRIVAGGKNIETNLKTINDFTIVAPRDTTQNIYEGMLSSNIKVHDIYNKKINYFTYNYFDEFDNDTHLEKKPYVSETKDKISNKGLADYSNAVDFVTITSSAKSFDETSNTEAGIETVYPYAPDDLEKIIMRRTSRLRQFQNSITLNMTVPGNTSIQAGDVLQITIGASSTVTDRTNDPNYTGRYLITKIRHNFNNGSAEVRHTINMTVVKDSVDYDYPNSFVQYENKGTKETILI